MLESVRPSLPADITCLIRVHGVSRLQLGSALLATLFDMVFAAVAATLVVNALLGSNQLRLLYLPISRTSHGCSWLHRCLSILPESIAALTYLSAVHAEVHVRGRGSWGWWAELSVVIVISCAHQTHSLVFGRSGGRAAGIC